MESEQTLAPSPFGPANSWQQPQYEQRAPVYAAPTIVPSVTYSASDFAADAYSDEDEFAAPRKKPSWLLAAAALVLIGGGTVAGLRFAENSREKAARAAEIEQAKQRMVELQAQERAVAATGPVVEQQAPATNSVAALLAASTRSNGAAGIARADAEKPRGRAAERQAAAIKRALSQPGVSRHSKVSRTGAKGKARKAEQAVDDSDGSQSDDPIYGL